MTMLQLVSDDGRPTRPANFPPGLIGDVAQFIYSAAPYPNADIALAGSIGLMAGIAGRAFNVSGSGLNLYVFVLAPTGSGKEAIAEGIGRLLRPVEPTFPAIRDYRGPGELVSAPGLIKAIAARNHRTMFCIIGEFGMMLKAMTAPNNANMVGLQRALLQFYGKSHRGAIFDDMAYSDRQNNPGLIESPSLSLIGESTPETFYGVLDERMIETGLLPRCCLFETTAKRPYQNTARVLEPSPHLLTQFQSVVSACLNLSGTNRCADVAMANDAAGRFAEFERWTTDQINHSSNETQRHLWSRAHLKALKIAALNAVGRDPICPQISLDDCDWTTALIVAQTDALIAKFENNEVGELVGNHARQTEAVLKFIFEYMTEPYERFAKYGCDATMHRKGIFTWTYLSRRALKLSAFKGERDATAALKRVVQDLADNDEINELPKAQVASEFNCRPRAFVVARPIDFMATGNLKFGRAV